MAAQLDHRYYLWLDLPLPEITVDDFHRGWTWFQLVASAKEWNADKQKVILPTLLRGKLVDYYAEFDEATRGDLERLKTSLMTKAGLVWDRLTSSQMFMTRSQWPEEKVADFVVELREAYPSEELTSAILLSAAISNSVGYYPPSVASYYFVADLIHFSKLFKRL